MATVQDLIDRAFQRSTFNDAGLASDAEMIRQTELALKQAYQRAYNVQVEAGVEPSYFGKEGSMVGAAGVFTPPSDAIGLYHVEEADGTEVRIVNRNDLAAELAPRLFRRGAVLVTPAETDDPGATDTLTCWYAQTHGDLDDTLAPDNAANTLDTSWRSEHLSLLVAELSAFLATKDGRDAEVQKFQQEATALWALFDQAVLAYHHRTVTRHG